MRPRVDDRMIAEELDTHVQVIDRFTVQFDIPPASRCTLHSHRHLDRLQAWRFGLSAIRVHVGKTSLP